MKMSGARLQDSRFQIVPVDVHIGSGNESQSAVYTARKLSTMGTKDDISKSFVRPPSTNQRDYLIKDLGKLLTPQLLELRDRQSDILKNKCVYIRLILNLL